MEKDSVKTVVYQSYRTFDVPTWINRCMQTVQRWAASQGFDYRFIDDRLFAYAPEWYRQKVSDNILLISDLARLVIAKDLLRESYSRTIWIDADVLVFEPELFTIDITEGYAFCRELWVDHNRDGQLRGRFYVNNAVMVLVKPNDFLDFYIHACKSIVQHNSQLNKLAVGTQFLTALYHIMPFSLVNHVGMFSPFLMGQLAHDKVEETLHAYRRDCGFQIYAANLCSSFRNKSHDGVCMDDALFGSVIDNLLNEPPVVVNE